MSPSDTDRPNLQSPAPAPEAPTDVILASWQQEGVHMDQVRLATGEVVVRRHDDEKVAIEA